jgi:molybdopterin-guanine dinucleotide biosynthesis protein A
MNAGSKNGMPPVTGAVLAGGRSRRMGQDKAFLPGRKKTLLEDTLDVMAGLFPEVLISGGDQRLSAYGRRVLPDEAPSRGPLSGLCAVLKAASHEYLFLAACDLPLFSAAAVTELWRHVLENPEALAVIPVAAGRLQPLHAFYHRDLLPTLEKNLERENLKLAKIFANEPFAGAFRLVPFTGEPAAAIAANVNTPEEWAAAREILSALND